jgi:uncharacterized protein (DUF952 family)
MLTPDAWADALVAGRIVPPSLAAEGFVHCTAGWPELANTGNRHYAADPRPYIALVVDLNALDVLGDPWRFDDPARLYPHVYGPISIAAITGVRRLPRTPDGRFAPLEEEEPMHALDPLLARLDAASARLATTRTAVEGGEPWPVGAVAQGGGEAAWGPTEVLSHVAEMLPYWLGEMERVIAGNRRNPGSPAPFGRVATDQVRSLTVIRDATLPARELYDRIAASVQRYRLRLPLLTDEEVAAVGVHPTRGELSVPALVDRFAVSHLEEHAAQLEEALGTGPG